MVRYEEKHKSTLGKIPYPFEDTLFHGSASMRLKDLQCGSNGSYGKILSIFCFITSAVKGFTI